MTDTTLCEYITHPGNIHELRFLQASRDAAAAGFEHFDTILSQHSPDQQLLLIFNTSISGELPVQHVMRLTRDTLHKYSDNFSLRQTALALVHDGSLLVSVWVRMLNGVMPQATMRPFRPEQYDTARAWLESLADA